MRETKREKDRVSQGEGDTQTVRGRQGKRDTDKDTDKKILKQRQIRDTDKKRWKR